MTLFSRTSWMGVACMAWWACGTPVPARGYETSEQNAGACSGSQNEPDRENPALKRLSGGFGEIVIDVGAPSVRAIFLRQPDGSLGEKSILCE
jgi:hypothetical protein